MSYRRNPAGETDEARRARVEIEVMTISSVAREVAKLTHDAEWYQEVRDRLGSTRDVAVDPRRYASGQAALDRVFQTVKSAAVFHRLKPRFLKRLDLCKSQEGREAIRFEIEAQNQAIEAARRADEIKRQAEQEARRIREQEFEQRGSQITDAVRGFLAQPIPPITLTDTERRKIRSETIAEIESIMPELLAAEGQLDRAHYRLKSGIPGSHKAVKEAEEAVAALRERYYDAISRRNWAGNPR